MAAEKEEAQSEMEAAKLRALKEVGGDGGKGCFSGVFRVFSCFFVFFRVFSCFFVFFRVSCEPDRTGIKKQQEITIV